MSDIPNIDPRIRAVGTSFLRTATSKFLRGIGEDLYLIHDGDTPVAVMISYEQFMILQEAQP